MRYNLMVRFVVWLVLIVPEISAQNPDNIHEDVAVDIGGLKQWISIRGEYTKNPVLLFLHGGPGNSVMSYADNFTNELKKHFVVVQWDQRESGKTAELNVSDKHLTVTVMEKDVVEMIHYLRARFAQNKILLTGHSWGGFLGLLVASRHPDLLLACVAVCPMVNQLESERQSLEWMINRAQQEKNEEALRELATVNVPFQGGDQLYYHRSWLARMMGNKVPARDFVEAWANKWLPLYNEASAVNFFQAAPEINCPVYFFVGDMDRQTSYELTRHYYETLRAPGKQLFIFKDTGHSLPARQPKKFQEIILKQILPLVAN